MRAWLASLLLGLGWAVGSPGAVYAAYGDLMLERGEAWVALGLYRRALVLDPELEGAMAGEAAALVALGEEEAALARLDAYLEGREGNAVLLYTRGQVRLLRGWLTGAYRDLRAAYERMPVGVYALAYARVAVILGLWEEAQAGLRVAVETGDEEVRERAVRLLYLVAWLRREG